MNPLDGLSHVAVVSADLDRLARFYVEVFDATLRQVEELPTGRLGIVRLADGAGLNIFELAAGDLHVAGLPAIFARGHIDHVGLRARDAATFWALRDRLVAGGHSTGEVADFGPVLGLDFTDPDGMVCELNLVLDPSLSGGHAPVPAARPAPDDPSHDVSSRDRVARTPRSTP